MTEIPDRNDPAFWDWMGEAQKEHHILGTATVDVSNCIKATLHGYYKDDNAKVIANMAIGEHRLTVSNNHSYRNIGVSTIVVTGIPTYEFEGYLRQEDLDTVLNDANFCISKAHWN